MDFKTFTDQHFAGNAEKAKQHLANESYYGDYSLTGSRNELKTILDTMTREETKVFMRCFKETAKKDKAHTENKDHNSSKLLLILPVLFFVLAIWMFITGCNNILKINNLVENGITIQATVTDVDVKNEGDNLVDYYTFSYKIDGKDYSFVDSPDRKYAIGDTFSMQVDPQNPEVLELPSSNLAFAFLLLLFSGASVFLHKKCAFLVKYIPHALSGWAILMLVTGILLPKITAIVLGSVFLVITLAIWILVHSRKRT